MASSCSKQWLFPNPAGNAINTFLPDANAITARCCCSVFKELYPTLLPAAVLALLNSAVLQLMTQFVASILYTFSPFAPRPTGAISCHVTECCSVIGWSAQQLAVRQVPRPRSSFAETEYNGGCCRSFMASDVKCSCSIATRASYPCHVVRGQVDRLLNYGVSEQWFAATYTGCHSCTRLVAMDIFLP